VTASATAAREEIGRAIAERIRDMDRLKDLEDVLPEIEKFLESPEERRLRNIRGGVITSAVGLGATFFFYLMSIVERDARFLPALGVITFLIGIGLIINGLFLTATQPHVPEALKDKKWKELPEASSGVIQGATTAGQLAGVPPSVTERTTHHLSSKPLKARRQNSSLPEE
jgi:hypothetical protein